VKVAAGPELEGLHYRPPPPSIRPPSRCLLPLLPRRLDDVYAEYLTLIQRKVQGVNICLYFHSSPSPGGSNMNGLLQPNMDGPPNRRFRLVHFCTSLAAAIVGVIAIYGSFDD